jgi:hypothetical protein
VAEAGATLVTAKAARDAAVAAHHRAEAEVSALVEQAATSDSVGAETLSHAQAEVELTSLRLAAVVNDLAFAQGNYHRDQVDALRDEASEALAASCSEVTHDLLALQIASTHYLQSVRGYGETRTRAAFGSPASGTTGSGHCSTPGSPTGACSRRSHPGEIRSAANAKVTGSPVGMHTRWSRNPQK